MGKRSRKSRQLKSTKASNGSQGQARADRPVESEDRAAETAPAGARRERDGNPERRAAAVGAGAAPEQPNDSGRAVLARLAVLAAIPIVICILVRLIFE